MAINFTFNAQEFLQQYSIDHTTEHHHCSANRIQVHCPFCTGNKNYHLGIHVSNGSVACWRCGHHTLAETIQKLLRCTTKDVKSILVSFKDVHRVTLSKKSSREKNILSKGIYVPPPSIVDLNTAHRMYLKSRKFNPDELQRTWGIRSIGPVGEYKYRIYIPITYLNEVVSFQGRSTAKHAALRYKTCDPKNEAIHHKNIIYGNDLVPGDTIVVVEGVTDAWRLGPGAVATFGTAYTLDQVIRIGMYPNVYIMFDNDEPNAQMQAENLAVEVAFMKGTKVKLVKMKRKCDPGELPQSEALQLMSDILTRKG